MSITQQRLDAYIAAEARILSAGLSVRLAERQLQEAELAQIRAGIEALQRQLAVERSGGRGSLRYTTVVFDP